VPRQVGEEEAVLRKLLVHARVARVALATVAVLATAACGGGISDGPSPHGITDEELRAWIADGATIAQIEKSLRGREPYSEHEAGSDSWALIAAYVDKEPGLADRSSLRRAMETHRKVLLHATRGETTWIFFEDGVAKEFYKTPNRPATGAASSPGSTTEAQG
jgi:hypothetical protein